MPLVCCHVGKTCASVLSRFTISYMSQPTMTTGHPWTDGNGDQGHVEYTWSEVEGRQECVAIKVSSFKPTKAGDRALHGGYRAVSPALFRRMPLAAMIREARQ